MQITEEEKLTRRLKQLYNDLRTAMYNKEYYGCKLAAARRRNKALEVLIAVGSSTVIGSWFIWGTEPGSFLWAAITGGTTLLAILKPIVDLPKEIERYSKLFVGHATVYAELEGIVKDVTAEAAFPPSLVKASSQAIKRRDLLTPDDDPDQDRRLAKKCQEVVNRRWPADSLWLP